MRHQRPALEEVRGGGSQKFVHVSCTRTPRSRIKGSGSRIKAEWKSGSFCFVLLHTDFLHMGRREEKK